MLHPVLDVPSVAPAGPKGSTVRLSCKTGKLHQTCQYDSSAGGLFMFANWTLHLFDALR
jgi:hypothetical protein